MENLGQSAKVFAIFSKEAIQEATQTLLPSILCKMDDIIKKESMIDSEKAKSTFYIEKENFIPNLLQKALKQDSYKLEIYDRVITGC